MLIIHWERWFIPASLKVWLAQTAVGEFFCQEVFIRHLTLQLSRNFYIYKQHDHNIIMFWVFFWVCLFVLQKKVLMDD